MKQEKKSKPESLTTIQSIVFAALCVLTAGYYFTRPGTIQKSIEPIRNFTQEFYPGWIVFDSNDLDRTLAGELPTPWNLEVSRTMMSRWRLKEMNPAPWNDLMAEYKNGIWISPTREEIEASFTKNDEQWAKRRSTYSSEKDMESLATISLKDNFLTLTFDPPLDPATIGSQITVRFRSSELVNDRHAPVLYWHMNGTPRSALFRRGGVLDIISDDEVEITWDMSGQPTWLAPGSELHALEFYHFGFAEPEVLSILGSDSFLLPVQQ